MLQILYKMTRTFGRTQQEYYFHSARRMSLWRSRLIEYPQKCLFPAGTGIAWVTASHFANVILTDSLLTPWLLNIAEIVHD